MSTTSRARRNYPQSSHLGDTMQIQSTKVKGVTAPGVKNSTETVRIKDGDAVIGEVTFIGSEAETPDGALAMASSLNLTKTVEQDGKEVDVDMTDEEKFLYIFNSGFTARARLYARNELSTKLEGPEKQYAQLIKRTAAVKSISLDDARTLLVNAGVIPA